MKRRYLLSAVCAVSLLTATALFSQETPKPADANAKSVDTQKTTEATQPGTDANRATPAAALVPAGPEKAKSFFDGATTFVNQKVLFHLNAKDNFATDKILYKIDGGVEQTFTKDFAIPTEGKHVVSYNSVDKIGNVEDDKVLHVTVDTTAPVITLTPKFPLFTANNKTYVSKIYSFNISATDELSGVNSISYSLNGKDYIDYATAFSIYTEGDVNFSLSAEDNVANKTKKFRIKKDDGTFEEKESLALFVDNVAPTVAITSDKPLSPVAGKNIASKEYKYSVAGADKESGIKAVLVRVDGKGDFTPFDKPFSITTNGDHYIEAKAIDAVGNISDTVILSVYVDIIPPKSTIDSVTE